MSSSTAVLEKRPVGRPRKVQDWKWLSIKVDRKTLDLINERAKALGMSQADYVRKLIQDDIDAG